MAKPVEVYILTESVVFIMILNQLNHDFIIIMYHPELTPNSYEMILFNQERTQTFGDDHLINYSLDG
jgi:hypothetical protein